MSRGAETSLCTHLPAQVNWVLQWDARDLVLNVELWKEGLKTSIKS